MATEVEVPHTVLNDRTRLCDCGHTMIETEVLYSDLYECCIAFWECAHCHGIYEEFLE